ncbi:LysM peptidoglycan-binding domain-containing protein [Flaviaesturariibacter flavus]|uniref:Peptidoglycan hydrolase n=1 Tax=Flaviaesturariibacter flavus TaxID=2502780 RepID=A0A4R1BBR4_9BACT|nr:glucosaminidase domain-containing protein [Flaviaesturariibacter flavus]TCJ14465.1 LysM peptidoglycan-binding domain-containing protein [Flaviaesturariibacter flavus]
MKKWSLSFIVCILLSATSFAQGSAAVRNYIDRYKNIAIDEEIRTGVPAAITLAQGIHESSAGQSDLVTRSNNHFGIKCKTEWTGEKVYHDDDERGECFRKYEAPEQSYRDHSDFLKNRPHYGGLFRLDPTDYEGWAYGLKKAGYATNPKYPQILIKIIRDYNLQEYTLIALGRKPKDETPAVASMNATASNDARFASKTAVTTPEKPVYPQGVFELNGIKAVFVAKGTSFSSIADANDISVKHLFEYNDMKPVDVAGRDQLVFLQRKRRSGVTDLHQARAGESLWDVAQAEGVRMDALLEYNGLSYDRSFVAGELIALSGKASKPEFTPVPANSTAAASPVAEQYIRHVVQPKETLYSLSKKYGVKVEDILQWNNLPTAGLKVGQEVRIKKS